MYNSILFIGSELRARMKHKSLLQVHQYTLLTSQSNWFYLMNLAESLYHTLDNLFSIRVIFGYLKAENWQNDGP